jgi:flagellar biosynthetic protein FlhB
MANDDKTEQPTEKRKREAREEGNVFQSKDIVTVAILLAGVMILRLRITDIQQTIKSFLYEVLNLMKSSPKNMISRHLMVSFTMDAALCALPIGLVIAFIQIVAGGVQTRFNFAKKALKPKADRMNPLKGLKRIISLKGIVEALKNIAKTIVLFAIVYIILKDKIVLIAKMVDQSIPQSNDQLFVLMFNLVLYICMAFSVIAAADFMFQRHQYKKSLMMTKQEVKDEYKNTEGNPEIKGRIKKKQREIAQRRMIQQVPSADVIIRNPTHVAVAIKYDPELAAAPVVLAKGVDSLALRIVAVGEQNKVPWIENKTLARALYSACELNDQIPAEYYGAVAELLVYIYRQQNREDIFNS